MLKIGGFIYKHILMHFGKWEGGKAEVGLG